MVSTLNAPVSIEGTLMRPGLSLGVASRDAGTQTSSELLRQADLAMYAAKEAGKNCYVHFRPEMLAALLERTQLTAGLRRAVELGQITVHYQPVISSDRLEVVQFEALARWEWEGAADPAGRFHPDRGAQRPDPGHRGRGAAAQLHRARSPGSRRTRSGPWP